jgi:salicylate hydroxylase/6-hydroxynicotinate 3-monooxygenase
MRIAVAGAGVGGLTTAIALRAVGIEACVYEQAAQLARVGAGIQQSPNAVRVLRKLGIAGRLEQRGFQPSAMLSRDASTADVTNELRLGDAVRQRYGEPYLLLHRADLHDALLAALPPDAIVCNKRLTGVTEAASAVKLTFADGTTAEADALIAADGVHSAVREQLFGTAPLRYTGRVGYRTTIPASALAGLTPDQNTKWWSADRHVIMYYITAARDELYVMGTFDEPGFTLESWSAEGDVAAFRDAFASFHPDVRAILDRVTRVHKWALVDRDPLPQWNAGRIVVLGDAAHPTMPHMGQGAAMALEDAAVLVRCIEAAGGDCAAAFGRFTQTRRERTADVQELSRGNTFLRHRGAGVDWVYGYDAWHEPLAGPAAA